MRSIQSSGMNIPGWFLYSLPNGLWAFAYALLISGVWAGSCSPLRYLWFATIPLLVIGFECLQGTGVLDGVFSLIDLGFGFTGLLFGILIGIRTIRIKQHEMFLE